MATKSQDPDQEGAALGSTRVRRQRPTKARTTMAWPATNVVGSANTAWHPSSRPKASAVGPRCRPLLFECWMRLGVPVVPEVVTASSGSSSAHQRRQTSATSPSHAAAWVRPNSWPHAGGGPRLSVPLDAAWSWCVVVAAAGHPGSCGTAPPGAAPARFVLATGTQCAAGLLHFEVARNVVEQPSGAQALRQWRRGVGHCRLHGHPLCNGRQAHIGFQGEVTHQPMSRCSASLDQTVAPSNPPTREGLRTRCCGRTWSRSLIRSAKEVTPIKLSSNAMGTTGCSASLASPSRSSGMSGCSMLCTMSLAKASSLRAVSSEDSLLNAPLASTLKVKSAAGQRSRNSCSTACSCAQSKAPTLHFSVVKPRWTNMSNWVRMDSAFPIHTDPLMSMPRVPFENAEVAMFPTPPWAKSHAAVSTANRTAGQEAGTAIASNTPLAAMS